MWITGPGVRRPQLAAFYRAADVFVTMSEHEGFCIPLLEAMAFDVPIVARRHAAIPETLGRAGARCSRPTPAPSCVAEACSTCWPTTGRPAGRWSAGGRERLADFHARRARTRPSSPSWAGR